MSRATCRRPAARRIAAERENVADAMRIAAQNRIDFLFAMTNTSEMRDGIQFCRCLDAFDKVVSSRVEPPAP